MPHVRSNRHLAVPAFHPVGHRVGSIVVNGKWLDQKVSDAEIPIRGNLPEDALRKCAQLADPPDFPDRPRRPVDGKTVLSREHPEAADMVVVLMGYQDAREIPAGEAGLVEPLLDPLPADPGVHQDMGALAPDIDTVAAASAGK